MMLTTAELRWFCSGTVPGAVENWFQQGCPGENVEPPEERTDLYLAIPQCEYLGIKLRQRQLEIKWREALGVSQLSNGLAGQLERWVKWTCQPVPETLPEADLATGRWISVIKARLQRRYQVFPDQSLTAVPVTQSINQGCSVELTKLSVAGAHWWSLAFEAFAEDADRVNVLKVVADHVLTTYSGPKLQVQESYAYPKWLSIVGSPRRSPF